MTVSVIDAYVLASEIEQAHAMSRAAIIPLRRGQCRKQRAASEYDPHAATELAELILRRLNKPSGADDAER